MNQIDAKDSSLLKNPYFVFCILLFVSFLLRLPSLWIDVLDVDETQFAGYANTLLSGGLPYLDSVDTKPLGIYWFYAVVFFFFGKNNLIAVHAVTALWVACAAMVCGKIAQTIYKSGRVSFMAALFYVIFTAVGDPKLISTSIVSIMMLPLAVSIYFILRFDERGMLRDCFWSGVAYGLACLFKYQAGINLVVVIFYLFLIRLFLFKNISVRDAFKGFLLFLGGGMVVGSAFFLFLWQKGVWSDFVFWSLQGSASYIHGGGSWSNFIHRGGPILFPAAFLWILMIIRCLDQFKKRGLRKWVSQSELLIVLWLVFSVIPVLTGQRYFGHYFLQLYPALAVLAAVGFEDVSVFLKKRNETLFKPIMIALVVVGIILPAGVSFALRLKIDKTLRWMGEENPKTYRSIGRYIHERTNPNDQIFVWGFATPIYYYADRDAASRFLWTDWQTGRITGLTSKQLWSIDTSSLVTPGSMELLLQDLQKNQPIYFVDTAPGKHHFYGKYPLKNFPPLNDYLQSNYHFEKNVKGALVYRRNN